MEKEKIVNRIEKNGYVVVNVDNLYYYTIGMGKQGKPDLIGFCHYPFGFFQVVASKHATGEVEPEKAFYVDEYKIPGFGMEPSRTKLREISLQTASLVQQALARAGEKVKSKGFLMVTGPDVNNFVPGEPQCTIKYDPDEFLSRFVAGVKEDIDRQLNEAQAILSSLGMRV